jgi:uncharacterized protein with NAD-binding domain and iron-sulfur cluster
MTTTTRRRIAVLGGGAGSLSTVFALTSEPDWQQRFDITVYQVGWRLGGKGASGRDRAIADRIYEHGFHMWMGFYANAFQVMRQAYDERRALLDDPGVFHEWSDAFKPHTRFVFAEHVGEQWRPWVIDYPTYPGDPSEPDETIAPWQYFAMAVRLLCDHFATSRHAASATPATTTHPLLARLAERLGHDIESLAVAGGVVALACARQLVEALGPALHDGAERHDLACAAVEHARAQIAAQLRPHIESDDEARRLWIVMDLGCSVLRGILSDRVMARGFDAIDDLEFREWLRAHGASEMAIHSTPVNALYAANFSYVKGDYQQPNFAAGVALQSYLRIFLASRGPFAFVLESGMGDVVFTPLYQVLKARGVKFRFFHRVTALRYDRGSNVVAGIELQRQVRLRGEYDPLYRVRGVDAWPSAPFCDQIDNGNELEAAIRAGEIDLESHWSPAWKDAEALTLQKGVDYDLIVLGISLGALGGLCREIVAARPEWRDMVARVVTVPTQSQQLWMTRDLAGLGWTTGSCCAEGFPPPLGQWLDATHALARETWPADEMPRSLAYFCDAFADADTAGVSADFPRQQLEKAAAGMRAWLETQTRLMWPDAAAAGGNGLDWNVLVDPAARDGAARLDAQFCRVNVDPSERFVLSVAGTTKYRLTADGSGVTDLYLTGDWVRNGFNVGCVESTVTSGLQCARAIAGVPVAIAHEHFFRAGS